MKKLILMILFFLTFLSSCSTNEIYQYNKQILDNYPQNTNYAFVTYDRYESANKTIDFKSLINAEITLDGKIPELIYNTRYQQTLVDDTLYFCYEYKRADKIGHHALGYIDLNTLKVYVDYFDYERYMFNYNFSTSEFVCYTFTESLNSPNVIDIVFFKDTNKLEFDYNLHRLKYTEEDIEQPYIKDFYIENDIKYIFNSQNHTLTNSITEEILQLPFENDLLEIDSIIKDIYAEFEYNNTSIYAEYISNGDELFLCIQDRPTNKLNAPFMLFKVNSRLSKIEYIGYSEYVIKAVVNLNK